MSGHGSIVLCHPLTQAARDWLSTHCPADGEHQYIGQALAVEPRYIEGLLRHAHEDGLNTQPEGRS